MVYCVMAVPHVDAVLMHLVLLSLFDCVWHDRSLDSLLALYSPKPATIPTATAAVATAPVTTRPLLVRPSPSVFLLCLLCLAVMSSCI
jgi:hypothetical protein